MKVQKVVRAQGEFAKVNVDFKDGDILKILDGGQIISGDFGDRHVFKVETKNGSKNLSFNQTSMNNLIEEFGDETEKWVNKEAKAWLITQSVSGAMKKVCYLTATNWDMVEDARGTLSFAKRDTKVSPVGTDTKTDAEKSAELAEQDEDIDLNDIAF